jgi:F0F1-type ATP synthase membrane subunit c/vacuolar-type H+-ATPase subunit K
MLTTAGNTFSSIGARLGMAASPGTCEGRAAAAGHDAVRDNPTLNAIALNSWFFFFIDAGSHNLE